MVIGINLKISLIDFLNSFKIMFLKIFLIACLASSIHSQLLFLNEDDYYYDEANTEEVSFESKLPLKNYFLCIFSDFEFSQND